MSNTTTKVMAGCGVGCLLITVALAGVGWMAYRWARTASETVDAAERAHQQLETEYGEIRDFTPPNLGGITADRMEAFLSVRESTMRQREDVAAAVTAITPGDNQGAAMGGLQAARAGMSLAPRALEFARARNEALIEAGMGPGEYVWIYWLTYHGWLGHPPGESLLHDLTEVRSESGATVQMHVDGVDARQVRWQLRMEIVAMLQNLERSLAEAPDTSGLRDQVATELAAVADDPERFPWQDGAPESLTTDLEPYRDRLEASYSAATNPFELRELD